MEIIRIKDNPFKYSGNEPENEGEKSAIRVAEEAGYSFDICESINGRPQKVFIMKNLVSSEDGFTPEEYTRLTGYPVPCVLGDYIIRENSNGKVTRFKQNDGNLNRGLANMGLITACADNRNKTIIIFDWYWSFEVKNGFDSEKAWRFDEFAEKFDLDVIKAALK